MKKAIVFFVFAVLITAGYFYLIPGVSLKNGTPALVKVRPDQVTSSGGYVAKATEYESEIIIEGKLNQIAKYKSYRVTPEQEIAALEAEQELLVMAEDYDAVRSDKQEREAHLQLMKARLSAYSDAVLPIVLEKTQPIVEVN